MAMPKFDFPKTEPGKRPVMLLTGASRGIGHATVKRFSTAGWRVITCSRQPFPEQCPWAAGPEDHIQVDLSDPDNTMEAVQEIKNRLPAGELHHRGMADAAARPGQQHHRALARFGLRKIELGHRHGGVVLRGRSVSSSRARRTRRGGR